MILLICLILFLVSAGASLASTSEAAFGLPLFLLELASGHSADTGAAVVLFFRYNTIDAAQSLVALLFPFGDQVGIDVLLSKKVIVKILGYEFSFVVHAVDISAYLVVELEYGP